jgi:hypothetical protein
MSTTIQKPGSVAKPGVQRPGAAALPPALNKPATPPAIQRPVVPPAPAQADTGLSTAGIPLNEAMEQGLAGSQMFGAPPTIAEEEGTVADLDFFGEGQPAVAATEPTIGEGEAEVLDLGDDEGPWDDDAPEGDEEETQEEAPVEAAEVDPFAGAFDEVPAAPAPTQLPALGNRPPISLVTPTPAKAPGGGKGFQVLQANGSIVFDTKLTHDLSTVKAAAEVWDKLYKPYADMTEAERYTRNAAGDILMRDRKERMAGAKLLAQALSEDEEPDAGPEGLYVTMALGKEQAQAGSPDLGQSEPTQKSVMKERCHNHAVGCTAMKLNHLQGTGKCFLPDCSCKGRCNGFVGQGQGGETAPEGTKSSTLVGQGQTGVGNPPGLSKPASVGAGHPGDNVANTGAGAIPGTPQGANPGTASGGSQGQGAGASNQGQQSGGQATGGVRPAVQNPAIVGAARPGQSQPAAQTQQGRPAAPTLQKPGGQPSGQPIQRPAPGQGQQAQAGQGSRVAGGSSSGQPQNPGHPVQTQPQGLQQRPGDGQAGTRTQQAEGFSKQAGPGNPAATGRTQAVSPVAPNDAEVGVSAGGGAVQQEGSQGGQEPIITGDLLRHIMNVGGSGPEHSDYWPVIPNRDMRPEVVARREYITGRFVDFWEKATTVEKKMGDGITRVTNDEFVLNSNSYRVVLAANRVSEAIESYAVGILVPGYNEEMESKLIKGMGAAAQAYAEAHKPLPVGQVDTDWPDYLEYVEAFKDAGLQRGMLIHEFQAKQQTQEQS